MPSYEDIGDEAARAKAQDKALLLQFLNNVLPLLSPRDAYQALQNLQQSLDRTSVDTATWNYLDALTKKARNMADWRVDVANLNSPGRLAEARRALNALGWYNEPGPGRKAFPDPNNPGKFLYQLESREQPDVLADITGLLDALVDIRGGKQTMSRTERQAYWDTVNNWLANRPEGDRWTPIIQNLLAPWQPTPTLEGYVGALPINYQSRTPQRTYSYANPRYT